MNDNYINKYNGIKFPNEFISIIVPLFNEEEAVPQLADRLLPVLREMQNQARIELILIDDGSQDRTLELLQDQICNCEGLEVRLLSHGVNRGIGAAMRTGFEVARGNIIATLDCDCTYAPEGLPQMLQMLHATKADIVTASPYHPEMLLVEQSHRFFLSRMASRFYNHLVPIKLYCYTSFFRVYRREWMRSELFSSDGFLAVTEILLASAYCGAQIVEFPVQLNLRTCGRSKMRTMRVIKDHLCLMGKTVLLNTRIRIHQLLSWRILRPERRNPIEELFPTREDLGPLLRQWVLMGRFH